MSSIRPLATITLLAIVGIFLYMKINETEVQVPSEIAEMWSEDEGYDISVKMPDADAEIAEVDSHAEHDHVGHNHAEEDHAEHDHAEPQHGENELVNNPIAGTENGSELVHASVTTMTPIVETPVVAQEVVAQTAAFVPEMPAAPGEGMVETPSPEIGPGITGRLSPIEPAAVVGTNQPEFQPDFQPEFQPETRLPVTPISSTASASTEASLFMAAWPKIQTALTQGELSRAHLLLSEWYGDPSLNAEETTQLEDLLSQLAGTVVYSSEHRLEPAYIVQANETLETIAEKYSVSPQLLAKVNRLALTAPVQAGQELKVIRGPFSALIDLSNEELTLMLDRRYAGKYHVSGLAGLAKEGVWQVEAKRIQPMTSGANTLTPASATVDRVITLQRADMTASGDTVVIRSQGGSDAIQITPRENEDLFDILTVGSRIIIRK